MQYIKVFTSNDAAYLSNDITRWGKEKKHKILNQSCSVSIEKEGWTVVKEYIVTVTYDDGLE